MTRRTTGPTSKRRDAPDEGWARYNRHSWLRDLPGFLQFFFEQCFTEPHSTKQIEDAVGWGAEIGSKALILSHLGPALDEATTRVDRGRDPLPDPGHPGRRDRVTGSAAGVALAAAIPRARLEIIRGGGHIPNARDPVMVNLLIRDFVRSLEAAPCVAMTAPTADPAEPASPVSPIGRASRSSPDGVRLAYDVYGSG